MGTYGDIQRELAIKREQEQQAAIAGVQRTRAADASRQAIRAHQQERFTEFLTVGRYIADTLVARGDRGNYSVDEHREKSFRFIGDLIGYGYINRTQTRNICTGWLLASWYIGTSYETQRSELIRMDGLLLSNTGSFANISTRVGVDRPMPQQLSINYNSDGRQDVYTSFSAIEASEGLPAGETITRTQLAKLAFDKNVSLADF